MYACFLSINNNKENASKIMQLQKGEIESKTAKLKKMCGPKKAMVKKMTVAAKKWL